MRRVAVKYTQDWLSRAEDLVDNKQAAWRVDPAQSGDAGAFGDIGTHAANLAEFITGEAITAICAELTMLEGRRIDDDGAALFRLSGGGKGTLTASQVLVGDINDLAIDVWCDEAGLHCGKKSPTPCASAIATSRPKSGTPGQPGLSGGRYPRHSAHTRRASGRLSGGFRQHLSRIRRAIARGRCADDEPGYATMDDALQGMNFLRAALESSRLGAVWVDL